MDDVLGDVLDDVLGDVLGERLIELIMKNKGVKQEEIAKELGVSIATVQRIMKRLSQEGIIARNGGKRFGYWTVK